jgi:hypothetical protein
MLLPRFLREDEDEGLDGEREGVEGRRLRSIQPRERRVSRLRARHRDPSNKRARVASPFCAFISVSVQPTRWRYELPTG